MKRGFLRFSVVLLLLLLMAALVACRRGGRSEDAAPVPDDMIREATPVAVEPAPAEQTAPAGDEAVITFTISGGIIGFCDELTVFAGGDYRLRSCNDPEIQSSLDQADRALVQEWHQNLADFDMEFEDNPGRPDNLATELVFNGVGSTEADDIQKQIVFDWVNGLVLRLRPQPVAEIPTPTPPPPIGPEGVCPGIRRPAVIVANYDNPSGIVIIDPVSQAQCDVILHQPPFGRIVTAGDAIYYPAFDPEAKTITVWQLSRDGGSRPLDFTATTMEQFGPFNFTVSADASRIAWAWAVVDVEANPENPPYYNNLRVADIDGGNPLTLLERSENSDRRYLEPVRFSPDNTALYYAMQPDGLGGMIFSFSGRYDTMYRLSLAGGDPELMLACPGDQQSICIGDISADGSYLAVARFGEGGVQVLDSSGSPVSTLAPPATDYVGWPVFSPTGQLAFASAVLAQDNDQAPPRPNPGYISLVAPPYTGQAETIYSDNSITALWEWLDDTRLIYGAMDEEGNIGTAMISLDGQQTVLSPNYALAVLR